MPGPITSTTSFHSDLMSWSLSPTATGNKTEATERIQKAFEENAVWLDLGCLSLNSIPSCIGRLKNLEVLRLNINDLESLPLELGNLSRLQVIDLNYNRKLKTLPQTLKTLPALHCIATGGTAIEKKQFDAIVSGIQSAAIADIMLAGKDRLQKESLLFSNRPPEVQKAIDTTFASLQGQPRDYWRYMGISKSYGLLGFDDQEMIAQRIENASSQKKDLYFLDLGGGFFAWVDATREFLQKHYGNDERHFHVIGVTGEGNPFDSIHAKGNVTTHKITGFKLENLLETFPQFNLELVNSVELIVSSWTLQHLVDPIGTLEQAYNLLSCGNGLLLGTGFETEAFRGENALAKTLSLAFGRHSYIAQNASRPCFALFRSHDFSSSHAKETFAYHPLNPLTPLTPVADTFAKACANMVPLGSRRDPFAFGGGFHGEGTYVLERLLGQEERTA